MADDFGTFALGFIRSARRMHDGRGRPMAELFEDFPDRGLYPDYYQIISKPVCLADMESKLTSGTYNTAQDFVEEMELLETNASLYNSDQSLVALDARAIVGDFKRNLIEWQKQQVKQEQQQQQQQQQQPAPQSQPVKLEEGARAQPASAESAVKEPKASSQNEAGGESVEGTAPEEVEWEEEVDEWTLYGGDAEEAQMWKARQAINLASLHRTLHVGAALANSERQITGKAYMRHNMGIRDREPDIR